MLLQLRHFTRRVLRHPPVPVRVALLSLAILSYGATGFLYFELPERPDLSWIDGAWYAVVTVTTVGYGDLSPITPGGRFIVALPLMFFGIGMLGYVLSVAASVLIEAKTKEFHGMGSYRFKNHLVIFNCHDVGKVERILDELAADPAFGDKDVVVVDEDLPELPAALAKRSLHFVKGHPARDETLSRANVDAASHAVILSRNPGDPHSDGLNVSITLAVEVRNANVITVVECVDTASEELIRKAGCDRVVCAGRFDAHFLSHEILNPGIQEVLAELTSTRARQQLYLTPIRSTITYGDAVSRLSTHGHLAVGVHRGNDTLLNPASELSISDGDQLISIGNGRLPPL